MIGVTGNMLARLPDAWKTTVTVVRGNRLDEDGDPISGAPSEHTLTGCLLAPKSHEDALDRSDVTFGEGVLFCPPGSDVLPTDRIKTPTGSPLPGTWAVDGEIISWPYGVQVNLRKE